MALGRRRSHRVQYSQRATKYYAGLPTEPQYSGTHSPPSQLAMPGEKGVICPDCGSFVKVLKNGNAVSHAPGGRRTNISKQQFRCPSSGSLAE